MAPVGRVVHDRVFHRRDRRKVGATIGILLALVSALVWGSGDFTGGLAARRTHAFQVLALSAGSGVAFLVVLALILREPWPTGTALVWAASAGFAGALGIAGLYRGLAVGHAATVAPAAAVLTAAIPVVFQAVTADLPGALQLAGFALAIAGIWFVARAPSGEIQARGGLGLALVAGTGFGAFLILIGQVPEGAVFAPLAIARTMTLLVGLLLMLTQKGRGLPLSLHPLALLAGALDAGGNVFYLLARQQTRLDIAAVLSSLYPVATVVLSRVVLAEPISRTQWFGAAICIGAIALITA